jgi:hypothetical protein
MTYNNPGDKSENRIIYFWIVYFVYSAGIVDLFFGWQFPNIYQSKTGHRSAMPCKQIYLILIC